MSFCIPKQFIDPLKKRMKEVGGDKLVSMSRQELADFFAESIGEGIANQVANSFRDAVLSKRKGAMKQWAKKTLTPEESRAVEKIADELTIEDALYENMDTDVIEKALGVDISEEEVKNINALVEKMVNAEKLEPDNIYSGLHSDYFKAKDELGKYMDTINPMSTTDIVSRVIFRGNLLFALKSVVTNVVGNTIGGISEKITNTILERKFSGVNTDLIMDYIKYSVDIYNKTGLDVVRAMDIASGEMTVRGEHFKGVGSGKGVVRSYGRFIEQYVFKTGQGTPDIVFASAHFADNVNILSTKMADAKGLTGEEHKAEARRLFLLATSLTLDENNVDHAEALQIKRTAVQYALTATYQNDTQWSKTALKIRDVMDDYTGNLALGTNTIPFVKTLVNISKLSLDMTGVTSLIEVPRLINAYRNGDASTMRNSINVVIRAGLGMSLAMLLAGLLDDDDYLPDYLIATPYQKEIAKLANAPYNSIRIGNKWVSLAYFGTFGYALSGMLGARNEQRFSDKVLSYTKNVTLQLRQTPVIEQITGVFEYIDEVNQYKKDGEDIGKEAISGTANFFLSRLIPSITSDVAKSIDDKERFTRYGVEGISDQLKNKIPFWRETLPPKYNGLGDEIPTEAFYWIILTGSRLKTAMSDNFVYSELTKLSVQGENVSIKLDTYQDIKIAKNMLTGKEYNELTGQLQKELTTAYANIMGMEKYKSETDAEKKKKYLMDTRKGVVEKVIRDSGYRGRINEIKNRQK